MDGTIAPKTKGKAKERPKDMQPTWTNEGRELVSFKGRGYLTQSLSNVTLMPFVCKSWDLVVIGGLEQISPANSTFLSIAKTKSTLKHLTF
jgi:hypothetical protein